MVWNGEEFEGNHKPLISKTMFYKAGNYKEKRIYTYRKRPHVLTGILQTTDGYNMR
jgi:hypothetical protein